MTVPARRRHIVLAVHLVATLALLGVSIVMLVAGVHAASRENAGDAHAIYALLRLLTVGLDLPLASIALVSGLLLAVSSSSGIFRHWWVVAKQALFVATLVLGIAVVAPSVDTMLELTAGGDAGGSGADVRLTAAAGAQVTLLLAAAALAVFKPGGAIRRPPTAGPEHRRARAGRPEGSTR